MTGITEVKIKHVINPSTDTSHFGIYGTAEEEFEESSLDLYAEVCSRVVYRSQRRRGKAVDLVVGGQFKTGILDMHIRQDNGIVACIGTTILQRLRRIIRNTLIPWQCRFAPVSVWIGAERDDHTRQSPDSAVPTG